MCGFGTLGVLLTTLSPRPATRLWQLWSYNEPEVIVRLG